MWVSRDCLVHQPYSSTKHIPQHHTHAWVRLQSECWFLFSVKIQEEKKKKGKVCAKAANKAIFSFLLFLSQELVLSHSMISLVCHLAEFCHTFRLFWLINNPARRSICVTWHALSMWDVQVLTLVSRDKLVENTWSRFWNWASKQQVLLWPKYGLSTPAHCKPQSHMKTKNKKTSATGSTELTPAMLLLNLYSYTGLNNTRCSSC